MHRFVVLLPVVIACGGTSPPSLQQSNQQANDNVQAVIEAVALHELAAAGTAPATNICLATRGGDDVTRAAVLTTLVAKYPHAVADDNCRGGGPDGPVALISGGSAIRLDIGPVTLMGDSAAQCNGGGPYTGGGSREVQYIVEKKNGAWTVTNEKVVSQM